jgi:hypothetical protein
MCHELVGPLRDRKVQLGHRSRAHRSDAMRCGLGAGSRPRSKLPPGGILSEYPVQAIQSCRFIEADRAMSE